MLPFRRRLIGYCRINRNNPETGNARQHGCLGPNMKKLLLLIITLAFISYSSVVFADELDMINRPVNLSGLTGLLVTTAPFTLDPGIIEVGASVQTETSLTPEF